MKTVSGAIESRREKPLQIGWRQLEMQSRLNGAWREKPLVFWHFPTFRGLCESGVVIKSNKDGCLTPQ